MASPKTKKAKISLRAGTPKRRAYGALGGAKPRMFRASRDVGDLVDDEVAKTNRTQSTVIDERLRRSYWIEDRYAETLLRNFGGRTGYALGFIISRATSAVEHTMHARASDSTEVAGQVSKAVAAIVDLVCKPAGTSRRGGLYVEAKAVQLKTDVATSTVALDAQLEMYEVDLGAANEPWCRVVLAIDRNLSEGQSELWWPLADLPEPTESCIVPRVPLRPSIDELRAVWCPQKDVDTTIAF